MKMRYLLFVLLFVFSTNSFAEDPVIEGLQLAKAPIDRTDMESIKRGAKTFASTCMACHTAVYLRYDKVAQEAGITYEKMPINVKSWPNGITPPDLSLEASVRGVDWIYTYLHSFYKDPTTATGANNLLVPNSAMTPILAPYQGEQELITDPERDMFGHVEWYSVLKLVKQGSMSPEEFDQFTADITNFLAYASEPYYIQQHQIGWWVFGFLFIMFIFSYLLKREYWKDVKKNKTE